MTRVIKTKPLTLRENVSVRIARFRCAVSGKRSLRWMSGKTATTLALGTALSIGGATEVLHDVHFLVRKDLNGVRVVKQERGKSSAVVAKLNDGFAANSVFKLSRLFPDRMVSQQIALFTDSWLPSLPSVDPAPARTPRSTFARINAAIRLEFFSKSMPYGDIIHEKALKYDVDPALVAAVMETESRFKTRRVSCS
jgi:hypothetical protein